MVGPADLRSKPASGPYCPMCDVVVKSLDAGKHCSECGTRLEKSGRGFEFSQAMEDLAVGSPFTADPTGVDGLYVVMLRVSRNGTGDLEYEDMQRPMDAGAHIAKCSGRIETWATQLQKALAKVDVVASRKFTWLIVPYVG